MRWLLYALMAMFFVVNAAGLINLVSNPVSCLPPKDDLMSGSIIFRSYPQQSGGFSPIRLPKSVEPQFVQVSQYRSSESGSVYGDVISHSKDKPYGDQNGRLTNVHETTHGINSYVRNSNSSGRGKINGFYVLEGRGVVLDEPRLTMEDAKRFVPQTLRADRWQLYMVQQLRHWNDTPTYICDEWVAYTNEAAAAVDDVRKGRYRSPNGMIVDGVYGTLEFSIYTIGLCMAVKEKDPVYWQTNQQFKNFVIWELKNSQKYFLEGRVMKEFRFEKQDRFLLEFLQGRDCEAMRKFVRDELDGAFLDISPAELKKFLYLKQMPRFEIGGIDKGRPIGLNGSVQCRGCQCRQR